MNQAKTYLHEGLVDEKAAEMGYEVYRPGLHANPEEFWQLVHEYKLQDPGTIQIILWAGVHKPGWFSRQQSRNSSAPYYSTSTTLEFTAF